MSDTANLISGAISQSGPAMFDQSNQQSEKANQSIRKICAEFPQCRISEDPDAMVNDLKKVSPKEFTFQDYALWNSTAGF